MPEFIKLCQPFQWNEDSEMDERFTKGCVYALRWRQRKLPRNDMIIAVKLFFSCSKTFLETTTCTSGAKIMMVSNAGLRRRVPVMCSFQP